MTSYDAIVVGSGLGGLTTAAILAEAGKRVLVLEQHYIVGGCASSFRRKGFIFDAAVHLIGGCEPGGELQRIFERLGVEQHISFIPVDPMFTVQIEDARYDIPANLDEMAERLGSWFPEDKAAVEAVISEIKQLGGYMLNDGSYGSNQALNERLLDINRQSFAQYLADRFQNPRTAFLLSSLCPYAGISPAQLSTTYMMSTMVSYHGGAFYIKGSSQKIADTLKLAIESRGGKVQIRRRVERILMEQERVHGVIDHKGNEYYAPLIISNADMKQTFTHLLDESDLPAAYHRRINSLKPSYSSVVLYAAMHKDHWLEQLPHELFWFPNDGMEDSLRLYDPTRNDEHPWLSICSPTHTDAQLAPEGYGIVSVMALCEAEHMEQIREEYGKSYIEEQFIALIDSIMPGFKERIHFFELATPRTIERYTLNQAGSIYGWRKGHSQRWGSNMGPRTPVSGLYLAGHWTRNVHGVYGVMKSGRMTADTIVKV